MPATRPPGRRHCGVPGGSAQLSCRSHGMATRRPGLRHPDLTARPCPNLLDRLAGPRVRGLRRLVEVQNVLRARGSPHHQEPVAGVRKRPPTADGDEAGVAIFGEDHGAGKAVGVEGVEEFALALCAEAGLAGAVQALFDHGEVVGGLLLRAGGAVGRRRLVCAASGRVASWPRQRVGKPS